MGRTHVVAMLYIKDGQGMATPVPHQLHPRFRLLNGGPKMTDGRMDLKNSSIAQVFDDAYYETCVGPTEPSGVVCVLTGTHFGDVFVQLILGHIHRSQVYDTNDSRILGEHDLTRKIGEPWHSGTGRIMVVDLIEVYGSSAVGVGTFYGYQCPMCVGVFVLGTSEEGDSDVNIRRGFSKARTLRIHIQLDEKGEKDGGQRGGDGCTGDSRNGRTQSSTEGMVGV